LKYTIKFLNDNKLENNDMEDEAYKSIYNFIKFNPEIAGIMVVNNNGGYISDVMNKVSRDSLTNEEWYSKACSRPENIHLFTKPIGRNIDNIFRYSADEVFSMSKAVIDQSTGERKGVILIDIKLDAGPYSGLSNIVLQRVMFSVTGVYNIPNLRVRGRSFATNNVISGGFRGFGGPQGFFAIEMHMENIADKLGIDSLELKKQYLLKKGDTSSTGGLLKYDIKLEEIINKIEANYNYKKSKEINKDIKPVLALVFIRMTNKAKFRIR
jgi:hypothetical protein